jgi:hypothetical protein
MDLKPIKTVDQYIIFIELFNSESFMHFKYFENEKAEKYIEDGVAVEYKEKKEVEKKEEKTEEKKEAKKK